METVDLINALRRMAPETGGLPCLGCGHEHGCSVHGCAVLKEAADRLEKRYRGARGHCKPVIAVAPDGSWTRYVSIKEAARIVGVNPAAGKIWERAKPKMVGVCPGRGRIVRK